MCFIGHVLDTFGNSSGGTFKWSVLEGMQGPHLWLSSVTVLKSIDRILVPIGVDDLDEKWRLRPALGPSRRLRILLH